MPEQDDERWAAVLSRTNGDLGTFYYAARTTRIYCLPTCAARRPKRINVEFFDTTADATAAGFRACKRCRPGRSCDETDPAVDAILAVCRWIDDRDDVAVSEFAARLGWSERHLRRLFKERVGVTITVYRRAQREQRVREALRGGAPVARAVFDAGYGSMRAFYDDAAANLGVAPATFRRGSPAETIRYGIVSTVIGEVLVAATARGVCAVCVADSQQAAQHELAASYPQAVIVHDEASLQPQLALIETLAAGQRAPSNDLPLDLRGTAFQHTVWDALRTIPTGHTATYAEVAEMIGRPGAHRAVANACATNPTPLLVPCHRIVRSDGTLGGYRLGTDRKAALLHSEARTATDP